MIQTQLYSSPEPQDLEASINLWIKDNLNCKVISIEYAIAHISNGAAPGWQAEIRPLFTALIVYQTPRKPLLNSKEKTPMKINRPTDPSAAGGPGPVPSHYSNEPIIIPKGQTSLSDKKF